MNAFYYGLGTVYIFVNSNEERLKVGFTSNSHNITERLNDINNKWSETKVRCQICGTYIMRFGFTIPKHVVSGNECPGGNQLPLELDTSLAESYLQYLKTSVHGFSKRRINTLEKRINLYRNRQPKTGKWKFITAYITKDAKKVESLTHKILAKCLDTAEPIGEIFCCNLSEAVNAVEKALGILGLLQSAKIKNKI